MEALLPRFDVRVISDTYCCGAEITTCGVLSISPFDTIVAERPISRTNGLCTEFPCCKGKAEAMLVTLRPVCQFRPTL
jgi:hypothetical protein